MGVADMMKEDAEDRTKWRWKICCGDLCWEKPKQEEGIGLAVSRHALNVTV